MRRNLGVVGGVLLASALAMACGSDEGAETAAAAADSDSLAASERPAVVPAGRKQIREGANSAPEIRNVRFSPEEPFAGEPLRVLVTAEDPDGDTVRLNYVWRLDGRPVAGGGDQIVLEGFKRGDRVEVSVTATDGENSSDTVVAKTRIRNRAPQILSVRTEPEGSVIAGAEIKALANTQDQDRDTIRLTYEWRVNGTRGSQRGEVFSTRELERGDEITLSVVASDGDARSEPFEAKKLTVDNTPPRIVSSPAAPGPDGVFRYQVRAEDPDSDRGLVFRLAEAPAGMTIDRIEGLVHWEPTPEQNGTFPIAIIADDRKGGMNRQEFELSVGAPASPAP